MLSIALVLQQNLKNRSNNLFHEGISSLSVFGKTKGYSIIKLSTQKNLNPRFFHSENFQKNSKVEVIWFVNIEKCRTKGYYKNQITASWTYCPLLDFETKN